LNEVSFKSSDGGSDALLSVARMWSHYTKKSLEKSMVALENVVNIVLLSSSDLHTEQFLMGDKV
jgi:hypothetical protein